MELLDRLADPLALGCLFLLLAFLSVSIRGRKGLAILLGLIFAGFYGLGISPVASFLLMPLEGRYPTLERPPEGIDAIVVLTGGEAWGRERPITSDLSEVSLERLVEAIRLWCLSGGRTRILFVGGIGAPGRRAEAPLVARAALALGVPPEALDWEAASRNTYENALAIRERLGDARFVLVTSAFHMPRAMAACRAVGLTPIPAPCGHRAPGTLTAYDFVPASGYLWDSALAIREYLALIYYRLRGWI
jgi:uncharacterized SAM-binding protein YcdF (DUF218 family)